MNFNEYLYQRLLENIPSKEYKSAAKHLGWPIRPEDEEGVSPAFRRIKIRRRKNQQSGSIMSGGGLRRLRRKLHSKVYTPGTETEAIEWQVKQKLRKGLERHEKKGNIMSGEDWMHYKARPSRKKKDT